MKSYLKILAIVSVSLYLIIAFVSFIPNPSEWDTGGRGAYAFFSLILSFVIEVSFNHKNWK